MGETPRPSRTRLPPALSPLASPFGRRPRWLPDKLGDLGGSYSSNMVLDLKIPHNQQYIEALDAIRADFLVNKITKEQAMQQIEQRWEQITNKVGRESQRAAYCASLGLTP